MAIFTALLPLLLKLVGMYLDKRSDDIESKENFLRLIDSLGRNQGVLVKLRQNSIDQMKDLKESHRNKFDWMKLALDEVGVSEDPGVQHNERILEYHRETSLHATEDETPWCSAFVCWVMEQSKINSTRNALAKSWLDWGLELEKPVYGCLVVLKRKQPWQGHVGFYVGEDGNALSLLGGNQSNQVSVQSYSKEDVLSYRWPSEEDFRV